MNWLLHLFGFDDPPKTGLTEELAEAQLRNRVAAQRLHDALRGDPIQLVVASVVQEVAR